MLSAALPGLGQSYSDDWGLSWKSLAFLGAEVAMWTAYAINTSKADKQTADFELYADEHWSVVTYADWIRQHIGELDKTNQVNPNNIVTSSDPGLKPWERVDWAELNRVEEEIGRSTGTGFTHRLPLRPEQQYYELIGKYAQYGGGWDDASYFTPSHLLQDEVSTRFLEYSQMRGRANDLYNIATTVSYVIVANHIFSALEAAWSTSQANKRVKAEAKVKESRMGGKVVKYASLDVSVSF